MVAEFGTSILVSMHMFLVNLVFFDRGMQFFRTYYNAGFYLMKYIECFVLLRLTLPFFKWNDALPYITILGFIMIIHMLLVWVIIPSCREATDASLLGETQRGKWQDTFKVVPSSNMSTLPFVSHAGRSLGRVEDVLETLWLLSQSTTQRKRAALDRFGW